MKIWFTFALRLVRLKYGRARFYTKKPLHLIPYWEGDIAVIIPDSIIGKLRFLLRPLNYIYIYVDRWKFCNWKFDKEVRKTGHTHSAIIDVREERFSNSFIMVYRRARSEIKSPENEIVMFWWKREYYKTPALYYYGELG